MNKFLLSITAACMTALQIPYAIADDTQPCGNKDPKGAAGKPGGQGTTDPVNISTGNDFRTNHDLAVFGGVGEHILEFQRFYNSRTTNGAQLFGVSGMRHSYQWEMADGGVNSSNQALLTLVYPDGVYRTFTQTSATQWSPTADTPETLTQQGNTFTLQTKEGWKYSFLKLTDPVSGGVYYQLANFKDSIQNTYAMSYDAGNRLVQVSEPAGRNLQITYQDISAVPNDFTNLATIATTPADAQWTEITVTDPGSYRYLRYKGPDNSHGNVAEVQFFAVGSTTPLTGTAFGSTPAYSSGHEFNKAFDGNTSTYVDSSAANGYTGLDLGAGNAQRIGKIRFYPRANAANRMGPPQSWLQGGQFQGTNQVPSTISVIQQVQTGATRATTYSYASMQDPNLPITYQTLSGVNHDDGTQATYTYTQAIALTHPLVANAVEPHNAAPYAKIKNDYFSGYYEFLGGVKVQSKPASSQAVQSFSVFNSYAHSPMATYGTGHFEYLTMNSTTGLMQSKTDALGFSKTFTYDSGGYGMATSTKDGLNRTTGRTHTTYNNDLVTTLPDASKITWTRDANDLPLSYKDELGHITSYTRDAFGRVTTVTKPDASTEQWEYNSYGQVTGHTLANGAVEHVVYNSNALKTSSTDALNKTTSYHYNAYYQLDSITDARNQTTLYERDLLNRITKTTHPDGTYATVTYDVFGNKTATTDERGKTTTYIYDDIKRLISVTDPLIHTTSFSYADETTRKPSLVTLPSGKKIASTYDANLRLTSQTTGYGTADAATVSYTYNAVGKMLSNTDPNGGVWSYAYDSRDRTTSMTDPLNNITTYTYDLHGNRLTTKRADNGVITNVYDAMNRLIKRTDPKNQLTKMTYDASNNLLTVTDPKNYIYTYTYDAMNRMTSKKYPNNSQESYTYDEVGNLATYTNRAGQVCTYTYDNLNRNTQYTWSDGTPGSTKTYDNAGNIITNNNGVSMLTYTYDDANRLLTETQTIVGGPTKLVSYTYDADGNYLVITFPGGTSISYAYDNRNRITTISDDGPPPVVTYTYDGNNNRKSKTLENGTVTTYTYDAANRLTNIAHALSSTTPFSTFAYDYNTVNNRKYVKREDGLGDAYTYDAVDQVAAVKYSATTPDTTPVNPQRSVTYTYDANGNRTLVTDGGVNTNYSTNNLNQYTLFAGLGLGYDTKGNLTSTFGWTYAYDAQNRLASATNGTVIASFIYDAKNRCVSRTINGVTTYFTYDGWSLIEEYDSIGTMQARYIHGAGIDELLCMVNTSGAHYYHHDALGNVTRITSATAAIEEAYIYDVYGTATIKDGSNNLLSTSAVGNRFLFTGREYLAQLGLYDYRNRIYSATLGRFLQTDPIHFNGGDWNIYRYTGNNSINWSDTLGLYVTWGSGTGDVGKGYAEAYSTPTGRAELQALENSTKEIRIQKNQQEGKKGEVSPVKLPDGGLVLNTDGTRDNYTHEAQHANEILCEERNLDPLDLGVDSPHDSVYPEGKANSQDASENRANRASNKMEREFRQNSKISLLQNSADKPWHSGISDPFGTK